jgi:hypothetical protein
MYSNRMQRMRQHDPPKRLSFACPEHKCSNCEGTLEPKGTTGISAPECKGVAHRDRRTTLTKICELLESAQPVPKKSHHSQKNADDTDVEMTDAGGGGDDKPISSLAAHAPRLVPSGCIL